MELTEYQDRAAETSVPQRGDPISFFIHGLAGEVGSIASEYKKRLRDGAAHEAFVANASVEIGDVLWYLASLASELGVQLDDVAEANLVKIHDRWLGSPTIVDFDAPFPPEESLPRTFAVEFRSEGDHALIFDSDGNQIGDRLTDNAHQADGYRFHDIIHLAFAAVLGWSPVFRAMVKRKRKSDPSIDEVEDGARAIFTEEGLATIVFSYARSRQFLEGVEYVDSELLDLIRSAVIELEVAARSGSEWEAAIVQAFEAWRYLEANGGGRVLCDLDAGAVNFIPNTQA